MGRCGWVSISIQEERRPLLYVPGVLVRAFHGEAGGSCQLGG